MANDLELKIKAIIPQTYNVKSYRLEVDETQDFKAGQFLSVALKARPELKRYLSISSSPTEKSYIEFTKKITQSEFSRILDKLKPGDWLRVQYPYGSFTLDDTAKKIAFLSGGIGITPIRSISKYVIDKNLDTDMVLIYANRTIEDIVFREDFDLMQKQCPKLKVVHVLSKPVPGFKCMAGLINKQVIKEAMPDYAERKFYICGPPSMVEAMKKMLLDELVLSEEKVVTENFIGY